MDAVVKQGVLHTQQQQKFGKKWKKVWVLLYGETTCSVARLEYFEFKEGVSLSERQCTRKTENKKVIKLSDCIRITESPGDTCPSDCRAFHVETIEKLFVFAAESSEYDDWNQTLCEMAFPMFWGDRPGPNKADGSQRSQKVKKNIMVPMEENSLYSTRKAVKEFRVTVRKTEAADRCGLQGPFLLAVEEDSLQLKELERGKVLYTWPYRFLRRFGRDKVTFSFEAGRRCVSGEGSFEFDTNHANGIFQIIESAIKVVRQGFREDKPLSSDGDNEPLVTSRPGSAQEAEEDGEVGETEGQQPAKAKGEMANATLPALRCLSLEVAPEPSVRSASTLPWKVNPGSKGHGGQARGIQPDLQCTYSEVLDVIPRPAARGKARKSRDEVAATGQESEYAVPFDSIAQTLRLASLLCPPAKAPDGGGETTGFSTFLPRASEYPLYDTIDERGFGRQETVAAACPCPATDRPRDHIYDEPEGSDAPSLYDYPEEMRGHAWRLQGQESDPRGHEYPYNPHTDDYAVPATAKQGASRGRSAEGSHPEAGNDSNSESEYDNILVKI
ncbi:docking protein 2-like [Leucoraja erinacea]|uniref:docking protein 2-like n=1 Tax=Leucoraja erinaceus TaxID=7782 RepID=UPI002456F0F9|nr:docking protein 2-like [Leucoraja erinacea]